MAGESISFISKTAVPKPAQQQKSFGFLVTIAVAILVVSLGVLGGAYIYKSLLDSDIAKARTELDKIKKEFEVASIRSFSQMASSIEVAKSVIGSHVAASKIFDFLQANALPSARFLDLNFDGSDKFSVTLGGEVTSFTALAEQAHVVSGSRYVRSVTLSDLSLRRSGNVGFNMAIVFDPTLIDYEEKQQ